MSLPVALQGAVAAWLETRAGSRRLGSAALSATYRAGGTSAAIDLGAYLVARLPATFAAVERSLGELARLRPDLSPRSLLDAGSGPGTAAWAAVGLWPALDKVSFLDNSPAFLDLAAELARGGPPPLAGAAALRGSIDNLSGLTADLVIAAYALAELPPERAGAIAAGLWEAAHQALVLVEPGTPQGFGRLRAARQALVAAGAIVLAPCTHALACPMAGQDWCHFSVRLARSRAHMHAKGARVPFEDERFSYLVVVRDGGQPGGERIVAPPAASKPGIALRLCTEQGRLAERFVARRETAAYKQARKLEWGDLAAPATEEDCP